MLGVVSHSLRLRVVYVPLPHQTDRRCCSTTLTSRTRTVSREMTTLSASRLVSRARVRQCVCVFMPSSLLNMQHMTSCRCQSIAVLMTVLTPHLMILFLHPPPTQEKTFLRCLDLSLTRTVDGPPGNPCQHWGTPTPVWRRWSHFMPSGRCKMFV